MDGNFFISFFATFNVYYEYYNCYLYLLNGFFLIDLFIQCRLLVLIHINIIALNENFILWFSYRERLNSCLFYIQGYISEPYVRAAGIFNVIYQIEYFFRQLEMRVLLSF